MEVQSQEISLRYHKLLSEIAGIAAIGRDDANQIGQKSASHIVAILFYAFVLTILADDVYLLSFGLIQIFCISLSSHECILPLMQILVYSHPRNEVQVPSDASNDILHHSIPLLFLRLRSEEHTLNSSHGYISYA